MMKKQARIWRLPLPRAIFLGWLQRRGIVQASQSASAGGDPAPSPAEVHEALPFPEKPAYWAFLQNDARPAIDILVAQVQTSFNEGQKKYKAGHFDKPAWISTARWTW